MGRKKIDMDETIWVKLTGDHYSTYSVYYVKMSIIKE